MKIFQKKQTQPLVHKQVSAPRSKTDEDMVVEERVAAADEWKIKGNAFFKDGKLREAMQQYEKAIAHTGENTMVKVSDKHRDMALAVKNPCHLNMAACLLKLKRFEEAIVQCDIVLAQEENNVKALFRRGKAKAELGQIDAARKDFVKASKLAPEDKAITTELRLLVEHDKAVYEKQKELYKGIFGPRIESDALGKQVNDALLGNSSFTPIVNLTRRVRSAKHPGNAHYNCYSDHW